MLIDNLSFIIDNINIKLINYNNYNETYNFKPIKIQRKILMSFKLIISKEGLNKLYTKYGFKIDNNNYLLKNRE